MKYLERGYLERDELPPFPSEERLKKKAVAYIECPQPIPCSPCYESCPANAIQMNNINDPPKVDYEKCTGCMKCIRVCPGLAIFMLRLRDDGKGEVTLQYEFLPWLKKGDIVKLYNRKGEEIGEGVVNWVLPPERNDNTSLVRVEVDADLIFEVRAVRPAGWER
ncbi:4Fe-4S dicluster domain-containing protein [Archaeoglobus neptunius]|uniref:4Fe-4S dicluster domain-containing protein n=1 Tax=Archaeoglobus neptunius TaxID=2798580 RepID=UPI001928BA82|nr:4Fe-4S binding protein [Archaeoglobus neptunius]